MKKYLVFFLLILAEISYAKNFTIFVSIGPQKYFAERICGSRADVQALVLPGQSPVSYSPTPLQISKLVKSKVYFKIGVPFENSLIPKIKSIAPNLPIIDTSEGIKLRKMLQSGHKHDHKAGNDPHIWLSPILAKKQSQIIYQTLTEIDPEGEKIYSAGFNSLINNLDKTHLKIKKALELVKGGILFVFHPAFGYFADQYGLKQVAVEIEGKAPKGRDLALFIKKAKQQKVRVVFVQPQFDQNAAKKIAVAINGAVVSIDPLAAEDYINNLETMADKIKAVLSY